MKRNGYILFYAFILGVVCALIPTMGGVFTKPYREANEKAEEIRNILQVLQVSYGQNTTSLQLVSLFQKSVEVVNRGNLRMYIAHDSVDARRITSAAVALEGPGIWGPIKGFLALDPDMTTIRRISFYQNEETPGLGGDIATAEFRNKFIGKKIRSADGGHGIKIRRSGAQGPCEIDGISGATLTCGKVQAILNGVIDNIDREVKVDK